MARAGGTLALLIALLAPSSAAAQFQIATHEVVFDQPIPLLQLTNGLPARVWGTVDLTQIDPRFALVTSVDIDGVMTIVGPGASGVNCQHWVEFAHPSWPGDVGNYQWQIITDSVMQHVAADPRPYEGSITPPTQQLPRKRVPLANGTFKLAWAYEPGCANQVDLSIVSALLPVPVAPEPGFSVRETHEAVFDYAWILAHYSTGYAPGAWHTLDLTTIDPRFAGVQSIRVEGILIQGPSTPPGIIGPRCDLDVYLRRPGGGIEAHYTSAARTDGGARTTIPSATQPYYEVPLTDGVVEFLWSITDGCAGGYSLRMPSARLP